MNGRTACKRGGIRESPTTDPIASTPALSRVSGAFPVPASFLGFAAIRDLPGGQDRLELKGAIVFGGLRAELTFDTREEDPGGCRGIISTNVPLLPPGVAFELDLATPVPSIARPPFAWLQLTDAHGRPIADAVHLGAVTSRPQPFTFPLAPLLRAAAWIVAPRDGGDHELVGELVFARGISLAVRLVTEGPRHAFRAEPSVTIDVTPAASVIPFSTPLAWAGTQVFRLASIHLVDGAGRSFVDGTGDPSALRPLPH